MKTTILYLKIIVAVILALIITFSGSIGVICAGLGIFGSAQEQNPKYIAFIPIGILTGFICVVSIDCLKYLVDKWGWSK